MRPNVRRRLLNNVLVTVSSISTVRDSSICHFNFAVPNEAGRGVCLKDGSSMRAGGLCITTATVTVNSCWRPHCEVGFGSWPELLGCSVVVAYNFSALNCKYVLLLLLLLLLFIEFLQGIYNYIAETNHVSRVYNITAFLKLQFMVHVMVFPNANILYFT